MTSVRKGHLGRDQRDDRNDPGHERSSSQSSRSLGLPSTDEMTHMGPAQSGHLIAVARTSWPGCVRRQEEDVEGRSPPRTGDGRTNGVLLLEAVYKVRTLGVSGWKPWGSWEGGS